MADRASPEARRIIAAMDQGNGHGHIRHEGWATEQANMRRAAYLEDPAQLDPGKRLRGIDGLKANDRRHTCGRLSTRICDPDAFVTAFARGIERREVDEALNLAYDPNRRPTVVRVPIADLLGGDGHRFCTGWQLEPVADSTQVARTNRQTWQMARAEGRQPGVPAPQSLPIPTFEGGMITFVIGHNRGRDGYEVTSMFPDPPAHALLPHRPAT
jgi:hypothetical protein